MPSSEGVVFTEAKDGREEHKVRRDGRAVECGGLENR